MKVIALLAACVAAENVELLVSADPGKAGADCSETAKCDATCYCGTDKKCALKGKDGADCDDTKLCASGFTCTAKKCTAAPAKKQEFEKCTKDAKANTSDCDTDLSCANGKCNKDSKDCKDSITVCIKTTNCNGTSVDTKTTYKYDWTCGATKNVVSFVAAALVVSYVM